jgi:hypothetical protein
VVIIICIWDDHSPLFLQSQWWLNTIHIGESLHNEDTKVSHRLHVYGQTGFLVVLCASTLWYKTFSQAYALVRINPCEVG